jgi:hypothetical protein
MQAVKYILFIAIFALAAFDLSAQSIDIVRTDVDSTREDFITSSYVFGFDVYARNVENCNAVGFELKYSHAQYVKFNEWLIGDFGEKATAIVIPEENPATDEGYIYVVVTSGESIDEGGYDNPRVIHLEFVLTQSAPHDETVVFDFMNPRADVFEDSSGVVLDLETEPIEFRTHSFINVWPGDADNSGYVDQDDGLQVALYFDLGSPTKSMRSFKRPNASTLWTAQRCLAWDSAAVTYADCDGNGVVTSSDVLVVRSNFHKSHSKANKSDKPQIKLPEKNIIKTEKTISVPVTVASGNDLRAVSLRADCSALGDDFRVIGTEQGEVFDDEESFIYYKYNEQSKVMDIAAGTYSDNIYSPGSNPIAYLLIEPENSSAEPNVFPAISAAKGVGPDGFIFPLSAYTHAKEGETMLADGFSIFNDNNILNILSSDQTRYTIRIADITGRTIYDSPSYFSGNAEISVNHLRSGIYIAIVETNQSQKTIPFSILR